MEKTKFCCDGLNAALILPLYPQKRKGYIYHTAIYKCKKCHELTLRGETNQKSSHTTFVEFIDEKDLTKYKKGKESYVAEKSKRNSRRT